MNNSIYAIPKLCSFEMLSFSSRSPKLGQLVTGLPAWNLLIVTGVTSLFGL